MMQTYTWWVDEPLVMASSNPSDEDLARLRVQGFSVVVSLLEEKEQPPRYDQKSAAGAGWAVYPIPIPEGGVPSRDQLSKFIGQVRALPGGTKMLLHCETGLGRSAFMGAVYWIAKGLSATEAIARVEQAGLEATWNTLERAILLHECAQLQREAGTR
jgi:protein-tyrosine phosphatase